MTPCPSCGGTDFRARSGVKRGKLREWNECIPCTRDRQRKKKRLTPVELPHTARPGYDGGLGWIGSPHIDPWLAWELDDAPEHWR